MLHRNYTRPAVAAVALFALAALTPLAPGVVSAQQNVNSSNTKAVKTKAVTPTRTAPPVKPVKTAQPPPAAKERDTAMKKSTKVGEAEKTTYSKLPHQYVIYSSNTGAYHLVAVSVRNEGKGPSRAGKVNAVVAYLSGQSDPRESELLGYPTYFAFPSGGGWSGNPSPYRYWVAEAELPPLKPGETVEVFLKFGPEPSQPLKSSKPHTQEWRLGVVINASNGEKMANGELKASFKDFLSYAFFNQ